MQRPLEFGIDAVVQSSTKYLNGHSDVIAGVVTAADAALAEQIGWWANCLGLTGGAFDSYLTLRGVRTLPVRMRQHLANAAAVVEALRGHPGVERLFYPGLPEHPGHEVAARQMDGFGAIVSFELAGADDASARVKRPRAPRSSGRVWLGRDDPTVIDYGHPVRQRFNLIHKMSD